MGMAEAYYPHPKGWRLAALDEKHTLERMTVRRLTAAYRLQHTTEPTCMKTWPLKYGAVDMLAIAAVLCSPLLTPRDFKSFYRIINRSMLTRNLNPEAACTTCRLCHKAQERSSHIGRCPIIKLTFKYLYNHARRYIPTLTFNEGFIMLGLHNGVPMPGSLACLHVILWKFVVIAFTRADTEGVKFKAKRAWKDAIRRFLIRLKAYQEGVRRWADGWINNGEGEAIPPSLLHKHTDVLEPCATVDDQGQGSLHPHLHYLVKLHNLRL